MDKLDLYTQIGGLVALFLSAINIIFFGGIRYFWRLTFEAKAERDKEMFHELERDLEELENKVDQHEDKNKYFRHNFESVTKGLATLFESKIDHLENVINLKLNHLAERMNEKKD